MLNFAENQIFCFVTDINECKFAPPQYVCDSRQNIGQCTNEPGSYICSCATGYQLAANQKTCEGKADRA